MPASFLDSNVVIYLAGRDADKAARSRELIGQGGWISVQVLNEVANVARRKMRLDWAETHELLGLVRSFLTVESLTVETHDRAMVLAERYRFPTYDSVIIASALLLGCDTLWSEDMQNGLVVAGELTVRNPFVPA